MASVVDTVMAWLPSIPQLALSLRFLSHSTSFMKSSLVMFQPKPMEPNVPQR